MRAAVNPQRPTRIEFDDTRFAGCAQFVRRNRRDRAATGTPTIAGRPLTLVRPRSLRVLRFTARHTAETSVAQTQCSGSDQRKWTGVDELAEKPQPLVHETAIALVEVTQCTL